MEIFKPYQVISESGKMIHLKLPAARRLFLRIYFRFFPLFLLSCLVIYWNILPKEYFKEHWYMWLFMAILIFVPYLMLKQENVFDIIITDKSITQDVSTFWGLKKREFPVAGIEKILLKIVRTRGSGLFYTLQLKTGKKTLLINLSKFLIVDETVEAINDTFTNITGLPLDKDTW